MIRGFRDMFSFANPASFGDKHRKGSSMTDSDSRLIDLNAFALALYQKLKEQDGNLFVSPFSISTCLAMAYAGARGETATQMAQALRFPLDQERVHPTLGRLLESLNAEQRERTYQLVVANALWGQRGYGFFRDFLDLLRTRYGSELHEVDFATGAEAARQTINEWVEEQTREKIKDLIGPGMLDPLTRLVLTNAIYFKGRWRSPFEKDATHPALFHMTAGPPGSDDVDVPMMAHTEDFGYMEGEGFQALELPYEGDAFSMVIFLPKRPDGLEGFEQSLTSDNLTALLPRLQIQEVQVFLPKFKMTSAFQLSEILRSMGMMDAFTLGTADFSGMTDREKLAIAEVIHKAFIEVNEEGTEAAAATATEMLGCAEPPSTPVFRADHPFVFPIRDVRSESILFMGRVVDPRSSEW